MAFIFYLTDIHIGSDTLAQLKPECERIGIRHPMIVSDKGVVATGIVERVTGKLGAMPFVVFDETPSNPTESMARKAAALYIAEKCDGLIAVGGGSSMDLAKAVAIMATHTGEFKSYATIEGGSASITAAAAPMIAVPTTSGTGSEVARGAILILDDGRKLGFHSWHLLPRSAICDPLLTLGLPPHLTAATGMDAIAHCVETFLSSAFNPPADGIALDGLMRAWRSIEAATANGYRGAPRYDVCLATGCVGVSKRAGRGALTIASAGRLKN
jgi:4-hydroxybutyrate dehydrogenase